MDVNNFVTLEELLIAFADQTAGSAAAHALERRIYTLIVAEKAYGYKFRFDVLKNPRVAYLIERQDAYRIMLGPYSCFEGGATIDASDIDNFHDDTEVLHASASTSGR